MRIALATKDQELIEQISALAARSGCTLEALEPARVLGDAEAEIRLIECAQLAPTQRSLAGLSLGGDDWLLMLRERAADSGGDALQLTVAPSERRAELLGRLEDALPHRALTRDAAEDLLGITPGMAQVRQQIRRIARFRDVSVIVIGESGTGKELVAEAIHKLDSGDREPFFAINCAAIPAELFETELFGCEATTGPASNAARVGLLEAARAGTVFLDEVSAMPLRLQAKLLRALETREFCRLGSEVNIPLGARVISATNRALASAGGALHPDLRFRLAGFTIMIPPLRERLDDLEALAKHFVAAFGARQGNPSCSISGEALLELRRFDWPDNVRQLRRTLDHAAILSAPGEIDVQSVLAARQHLAILSADREARAAAALAASQARAEPRVAPGGLASLELDGATGAVRVRGLLAEGGGLRDIERDLILAAFRESDGNLSQTSRLLGLPRTTLRAKLRRYGAL